MADKELKIKISIDKKTGGIKVVNGEFEELSHSTRKASKDVDGFNKSLRNIAIAAGSVYALKQAFDLATGSLSKLIDTASIFETQKSILKTLEGDSLKAEESFKWIQEFTAKTPYELEQVAEAFLKAKAYGIDPTNGSLKTLGDTAAGMGKSLEQAVEAMADAMTGENERLKEFGIKAKVVGDEVVYNWTTSSGKAKHTIIKNNSEVIQSTLQALFNSKYSGAMQDQMDTWNGIVSNMSDTYTNALNDFAINSGLFEVSKTYVKDFTKELTILSTEMNKVFSGESSYIAEIDFLMATTSRTIDMFNLLYETVENTAQNAVSGIASLVYGTLAPITHMLSVTTEALNNLNLSSDENLMNALELEASMYSLAEKSQKDISNNTKELTNALYKANTPIEERIRLYRLERDTLTKNIKLVKESTSNTHDFGTDGSYEKNKLAEVEKSLAMSTSNWINYYETIGDYQTAWNIKQGVLAQEYKDLSASQYSTMYSNAKKEYFDKINEEEIKEFSFSSDALANIEVFAKAQEDRAQLEENWQTLQQENANAMIDSQISLVESTNDWMDSLGGIAGEYQAISKAMSKMRVDELKATKAQASLDDKFNANYALYSKDEEKASILKQQYIKDTAKIEAEAKANEINGYATLAGAMSQSFAEGSSGAEAFKLVQQSLALYNGITAITGAWASAPFPANLPAVAATSLAVGGLLSQMGTSIGSGDSNAQPQISAGSQAMSGATTFSDINQVTNDYGAVDFDPFIEALGKAKEALQDFGSVGTSLSKEIEAITGQIQSIYRVRNSDYQIDYYAGVDSAFANIEGIEFEGVTPSHLNANIKNYANNALVAYKEELSEIIIEATSESLDFDLLSVSELDDLVGNFDLSTYEETLSDINNFAIELKQLQIAPQTDENLARIETIKEKLLDLYTLPENLYAKGKDWKKPIELMKEYQETSTANIKTWTDSFKTQEQLVQDQANALGVVYANNLDDLQVLYTSFKDSTEGLTDSKLELLEANKDLIESNEALAKSMDYSLDLATREYELQTLKNNALYDSIAGTKSYIDSLRGIADLTSNVFEDVKTAAMSNKEKLFYFGSKINEEKDSLKSLVDSGSGKDEIREAMNSLITYSKKLSDVNGVYDASIEAPLNDASEYLLNASDIMDVSIVDAVSENLSWLTSEQLESLGLSTDAVLTQVGNSISTLSLNGVDAKILLDEEEDIRAIIDKDFEIKVGDNASKLLDYQVIASSSLEEVLNMSILPDSTLSDAVLTTILADETLSAELLKTIKADATLSAAVGTDINASSDLESILKTTILPNEYLTSVLSRQIYASSQLVGVVYKDIGADSTLSDAVLTTILADETLSAELLKTIKADETLSAAVGTDINASSDLESILKTTILPSEYLSSVLSYQIYASGQLIDVVYKNINADYSLTSAVGTTIKADSSLNDLLSDNELLIDWNQDNIPDLVATIDDSGIITKLSTIDTELKGQTTHLASTEQNTDTTDNFTISGYLAKLYRQNESLIEQNTRNMSSSTFDVGSTVGSQEHIDLTTLFGTTNYESMYDTIQAMTISSTDLDKDKEKVISLIDSGHKDALKTMYSTDVAPSDMKIAIDSLKDDLALAQTWFNDSYYTDWNVDQALANVSFTDNEDYAHIKGFTKTGLDYLQSLSLIGEYVDSSLESSSGDYYYGYDAYKLRTEYAEILNFQKNIEELKENDLEDVVRLSAIQGFSSGGYTGDYGINTVTGLVHGQEYVVNHSTVKDLGLNNNSGGVFKEILTQNEQMNQRLQETQTIMIQQANEIRTMRKEIQDMNEKIAV